MTTKIATTKMRTTATEMRSKQRRRFESSNDGEVKEIAVEK